MLSCYIVSDASTVEVLTGYAKRISLFLKGHGNSLANCFTEILLSKPDILYLDISSLYDHPDEFEVLKQTCSLFLLSDKAEDAFNAFEYHAFDYLLRPLDYFRFTKGIERFRTMRVFFFKKELNATSDDFFFIKADNHGMKELRIRYVDVIFVEAMQNYVVLNMEGGGVHTSLITMREMELHLPATLFSRIHKSCIVNDGKIASIEGYMVNLTDGKHQFQIGSTYRKIFFDKINERMVLGQRRRIS
jgi:two-component system LytT family response regulator